MAHEQTEKSELIRRLIAKRWLTLQAGKTLLERRGGHPEHLLKDAPTDLSERSNRKKAINISTSGIHDLLSAYTRG